MATEDTYRRARNLVGNLLTGIPTEQELEDAIDEVSEVLSRRGESFDRSALLRELEAAFHVFQPDSVSLSDDVGHIEWLTERQGQIEWRFWDRYVRYLQEEEGLPSIVLQRLDSTTERIIGRLEDPNRPGTWDRRGMVVGQVQSGKTGNYTGLICRAADAGYKLVVVLAGLHKSLRSQTQQRLDLGFLGFDTQARQFPENEAVFRAAAIGVGRLLGAPRLTAASITNSNDKGDFLTKSAQTLNFQLGDYPVLLVVKKNAKVLQNLREWILSAEGTGEPRRIRSFPILMIDDEADNASINTRRVSPESDTSPTAVNGAIRKLLSAFERRAYIGYTATPYANIYIDPDGTHSELGEDLFPKSFIEYLRPPSNYFGPERLFGIEPGEEELPLFRKVEDQDPWVADGHKNNDRVGPLPESLRTALRAFILSRAARLARGQIGEHNSMLIHVTRFQSVQNEIRLQVDDELEILKSRIRYGDGRAQSIRDELHELWEDDFVSTSESMGTNLPAWDEIEQLLEEAVRPIVVKTIHGGASDALEYFEQRASGLNVIAIGGNKLSRGLTLEGLTVSYYLRASRTFDTLLQMGRWFGYRNGYEDLCRLYTSEQLWNAYREVSIANAELISEFEEMALMHREPIDFGLKVKESVQGMLVTAANKMYDSQLLRIGFAGGVSETVVLPCDAPRRDANFEVLNRFVERLQRESFDRAKRAGNTIWSGVPGSIVASEFFDKFITPDVAWRVHAQSISSYIRKCMAADELTDWTVSLISSGTARTRFAVGGIDVGLTVRAPLEDDRRRMITTGLRSIRRIVSPTDEYLDFDVSELPELLERTVEDYRTNPGRRTKTPTTPSGRVVRRLRPPQRGHLLLYPLEPVECREDDALQALEVYGIQISPNPLPGFAVSFPGSYLRDSTVEYRVNRVFLNELFGDDVDDPDDDAPEEEE